MILWRLLVDLATALLLGVALQFYSSKLLFTALDGGGYGLTFDPRLCCACAFCEEDPDDLCNFPRELEVTFTGITDDYNCDACAATFNKTFVVQFVTATAAGGVTGCRWQYGPGTLGCSDTPTCFWIYVYLDRYTSGGVTKKRLRVEICCQFTPPGCTGTTDTCSALYAQWSYLFANDNAVDCSALNVSLDYTAQSDCLRCTWSGTTTCTVTAA